jgi:hypothetical protein
MIQRKSYLQDDWKKFIATRLGEYCSHRMLKREGQSVGLKDCKRIKGGGSKYQGFGGKFTIANIYMNMSIK